MNISERTKDVLVGSGLVAAGLLYGGLSVYTEIERPEITIAASTSLSDEEAGVLRAQMLITGGAVGALALAGVRFATLAPSLKRNEGPDTSMDTN